MKHDFIFSGTIFLLSCFWSAGVTSEKSTKESTTTKTAKATAVNIDDQEIILSGQDFLELECSLKDKTIADIRNISWSWKPLNVQRETVFLTLSKHNPDKVFWPFKDDEDILIQTWSKYQRIKETKGTVNGNIENVISAHLTLRIPLRPCGEEGNLTCSATYRPTFAQDSDDTTCADYTLRPNPLCEGTSDDRVNFRDVNGSMVKGWGNVRSVIREKIGESDAYLVGGIAGGAILLILFTAVICLACKCRKKENKQPSPERQRLNQTPAKGSGSLHGHDNHGYGHRAEASFNHTPRPPPPQHTRTLTRANTSPRRSFHQPGPGAGGLGGRGPPSIPTFHNPPPPPPPQVAPEPDHNQMLQAAMFNRRRRLSSSVHMNQPVRPSGGVPPPPPALRHPGPSNSRLPTNTGAAAGGGRAALLASINARRISSDTRY